MKIIVSLIIISIFTFAPAHAQDSVPIDRAIQEVVDYLDTRLPARSVYRQTLNSVEIKKWTTNNEWSFFKCPVEAGNTTIQFTTQPTSNYFLFLDDILIYYTE